MKLSITQRLTITVALISGVIFAVGGIVFYKVAAWRIQRAGDEKAAFTVRTVNEEIWDRLDEDILTDFTGERIPFDKLRMNVAHWAVVRKDGRMEAAKGLFLNNSFVAQRAVHPDQSLPDMGQMKLATAELVPKTSLAWNALPEAVRNTVLAQTSDGVFLSARREMAGRADSFEVKWLYADHILEMTLAHDGELLESEPEDLPGQLPEGMATDLTENGTDDDVRIVQWQPFAGSLIAIVDVPRSDGSAERVAINRLGERYDIGADGKIAGRSADSELWVVAAYDLNRDLAAHRAVSRAVAGGGLLMWLLIVGIAWAVTRQAMKRVDAIISEVQQIDPAHLDARIPVGAAEDELSRISLTINTMLDRIQAGYQREQQFTGDASHEMRNPLAKIVAEIDLVLSRHRENKDYEETLGRLRKYAQGMQQLIESLLLLTRLDGMAAGTPANGGSGRLEIKPFDVADLAVEVLKTLPGEAAGRIRLELSDSNAPMQALGHRHLIGIMLSNLIDNALRYSPPDRPVTVQIGRNGRDVHVEVRDEGPGIPEEQTKQVFNRFARLEKSRSRETGGVGLGLSIVQTVARMHRTEVQLVNGTGKGTRATFTLTCANHS